MEHTKMIKKTLPLIVTGLFSISLLLPGVTFASKSSPKMEVKQDGAPKVKKKQNCSKKNGRRAYKKCLRKMKKS
jgi:hypothetical protein